MTLRRAGGRWLRVAISLVLAACGDAAKPDDAPCVPAHRSAAPSLSGPYCVAMQRWLLTDAARAEPFTRDDGDSRKVALTLHYPIARGSHAPGAPYGDVATWGLTFGKAFSPGMLSQAVLGGDIARSDAGFPLLVYSPGLEFGLSDTNTFMIHDLVSHGYVVAAVDHPYVSLAVRLEDGHIAHFGDERVAVAMPEDVRSADDVYAFPIVVNDLRFVITQVAALADGEPALHGGLDLRRVAAFGHSYGGAAAAELVRSDPRVSAAIDYDGRFHADVLADGVDAPLLLVSVPGRITADPPPNDNYDYRAALATARPGYFAEVAGAVHGSFQADVPWLLAHTTNGGAAIEMPKLDPDAGLALFNTLNRTFFAAALGGAPATALAEVAHAYGNGSFGIPR